MKVTKSRKKILDAFSDHKLLTANDLGELVPDIDRATIYRNLKRFVEEGILSEINVDSSKSYYEMSNEQHLHFLCKSCSKIYHFEANMQNFLKKNIPSKYKVESVDTTMQGLCDSCQ